MGIADLWSILNPGFERRQTLPVFVSAFISQHGRPPRFAIDTYIFLFLSGADARDDEELEADIAIRNFMAKLLYLTSLNVSYVVVLDGKFKPNKLRNGSLAEDYDYDSELRSFRLKYHDHSTTEKVPEKLIQRLQECRIEYIRAPAEAEAECAMLQRCGVVDYVVTNDVDVLVFGATKVLRNFNKYKEDVLFSPSKNPPQDKEYLVTPVHMEKITENTGLDRNRLVLVSTLMGGDYSSGTHRVGLQNAVKIALCGTPFAAIFHRSPTKKKTKEVPAELPDFSQRLVDCFVESTSVDVFQHWNRIRLLEQRREMLALFVSQLNKAISDRPRDVFGRLVKLPAGVLIEETYVLLYLFPIVGPRLFKFLSAALSNCETENASNELLPVRQCLPVIPTDKTWVEAVPRFNILDSDSTIGSLLVTFTSKNGAVRIERNSFESSLGHIHQRNNVSYLPSVYRYRLKSILPRILERAKYRPSVRRGIAITRQKLIDDQEFCMVKYFPLALRAALFDEAKEDSEESQPASQIEKPEIVWLPRNLIGLVNQNLLNEFDEVYVKSVKQSPKKMQLTTLDTLGMKITGPATSPRRRKKKSTGSNQLLVTSFFNRSPSPELRETDPFVDESNHPKSFEIHTPLSNYGQMQNAFSSVPQLSSEKRQNQSTYSSPPKRKRSGKAHALQISPESSPIKPATQTNTDDDFRVPSSSASHTTEQALTNSVIIEVASHSEESDCDSVNIHFPSRRHGKRPLTLNTSQESY